LVWLEEAEVAAGGVTHVGAEVGGQGRREAYSAQGRPHVACLKNRGLLQ